MKKFITSLILLLSITICNAENITINATFDPPQITRGQLAKYKITVSNSQDNAKITLPKINNLNIIYQSASNHYQIINGNTSTAVVNEFGIKITETGTYIIPSFEIEIKDKKYTVPEAKITVTDNNSIQNSENKADIITLELKLNNTNFYVGQYIPVEIKLKAQQNVAGNILSLPAQNNNAFANIEITNNPIQSQETINGVTYNTFTWNTFINPIKAGQQKIEYKLDMAINLPGKANVKRPSVDDLFSGRFSSIFDEMFNNQAEPIELYSKPYLLDVQNVPENGKPDNFTGAIGDFDLSEPKIDHETIQVGEPITLKFSIQGKGNFKNISIPNLNINKEEWKTYTPKSYFNSKDKIEYEGVKTFEYILIPQNKEVTQTPEVEFNYFNPEIGQYKTLNLKQLPITITPAPETTAYIPNITPTTTSSFSKTELPKEAKLIANQLKIKNTFSSLSPIFLNQKFIITQTLIAILILSLYLIGKRRKHIQENFEYFTNIEKNKKISEDIHNIKNAYNKGDINNFYHSIINGIQDAIDFQIDANAHSLTLNEVIHKMKLRKLSEEKINAVKNIFSYAEHIKYSGIDNVQEISKDDLNNALKLIEELKK